MCLSDHRRGDVTNKFGPGLLKPCCGHFLFVWLVYCRYSERWLGAEADVPQHLALHEERLAAGGTSRLVSGGHAERLGRRRIMGSLFLLVRSPVFLFKARQLYCACLFNNIIVFFSNSYNAIKAYIKEGRQTELSPAEHLVSAAQAGRLCS